MCVCVGEREEVSVQNDGSVLATVIRPRPLSLSTGLRVDQSICFVHLDARHQCNSNIRRFFSLVPLKFYTALFHIKVHICSTWLYIYKIISRKYTQIYKR